MANGSEVTPTTVPTTTPTTTTPSPTTSTTSANPIIVVVVVVVVVIIIIIIIVVVVFVVVIVCYIKKASKIKDDGKGTIEHLTACLNAASTFRYGNENDKVHYVILPYCLIIMNDSSDVPKTTAETGQDPNTISRTPHSETGEMYTEVKKTVIEEGPGPMYQVL